MLLAHYFGTSAQMWMNLQTAYDLGPKWGQTPFCGSYADLSWAVILELLSGSLRAGYWRLIAFNFWSISFSK